MTEQTIGRYRVIGKLGSGGSGKVLKAYDPVLQRDVAIKIPHDSAEVSLEKAQEIAQGFYHEAVIGGTFHHPNIVTIYDVGRDYGTDFLVMECVPGQSLKHYMQAQKQLLSIDYALEVVYRSALGLDYMHYYQIIHRDVKPSNVMVNPEQNLVKLMDFSCASKLTDTIDRQVGSLAYMAPENHHADWLIDVRTDIFSAGAMLYEVLTGKKAFAGRNSMESIYKAVNEEPAPITDYRDDVPDYIVAIVDKALRKKPEERYATALDLADALHQAQEKWRKQANIKLKQHRDEHYLLLRKDVWFKHFSPEQVEELMAAGAVEIYSRNQIILSEGENNKTFYIILQGQVRIFKGQQAICHLAAGDCFGEMSYLSAIPATASVVAESVVMLWEVTPALMENASGSSQLGFYKAFLSVMIKRLMASNENIAKLQEILFDFAKNTHQKRELQASLE